MTSKTQKDMGIVIATIGNEIALSHQLLLDFEIAIQRQDPDHPLSSSDIQGFDLAMQILNDVEHLARKLHEFLPDKPALASPLPLEGLRLERIREKLASNPQLLAKLENATSNDQIEFF